MKKIKITTPENIDVEYALAGIGSRSAAAFIDMLVQGLVVLVLLIAVYLIMRYSGDFWANHYGWIIGISLIIFTLVMYAYFIVMELNMNGATLGKKVLHIRTIRDNGQPLTLKHSAIRNLLKIFIDMFGIGLILMFFSGKYKRLGDMAASTVVIADDKIAAPVTLDSLEKINENFDYYISDEERELLREYFQRRSSLENYTELREKLVVYFTKKFKTLGIFEEWKSFINEL